jgi:hypothetical protein
MKRVLFFVAVTLCLQAGCSNRSPAPPSDAEAGEKALITALEAWKSGKSQDDLKNAMPSIIMNEDDWRTGKRLLEFKVAGGSMTGRQVTCKVQIKLQDKEGKTAEKKATYIIDTNPRIVIVRDSFAT